MADLESNIPTLTHVMHRGNDNMRNHFDAHQFDEEAEKTDSTTATENASAIENSNPLENTELNKIPSIKVENDNIDEIESQDFSEAMQSITSKAPANKLDKNELKERIDQAIVDALPGIEAHLKKQLYTRFGV